MTALADAIAQCGDGLISGSEECDDGNIVSQDGCSECCRVDIVCGNDDAFQDMSGNDCAYYQSNPSMCESADNHANSDGMSASHVCCACGGSAAYYNCQNDDAFQDMFGDDCAYYQSFPSMCEVADTKANSDGIDATEVCCACGGGANVGGANVSDCCGNGIKASNEECDDGNLINGDGCSRCCTTEQGYDCSTEICSCKAPENPSDVCGDGEVTDGEACDSGVMNGEPSDGCSECCLVKLGWKCKVMPGFFRVS